VAPYRTKFSSVDGVSPLIKSNPSLEAIQLTNITNELFTIVHHRDIPEGLGVFPVPLFTIVIIYKAQFQATDSFRLM